MRAPLVLLLALPVLAGESVPLQRKLSVGSRAKVTERTRTELQVMARGRGSSVGETEVSEVVRRYLEEVRTSKPEGLWREYELSTRAKARRGAPLPDPPERTSIHGRAVLVSGLEQKPDGPFEISKEDREALRLDRLAAALLPAAGQAGKGEEWTVPAAVLGKALFGDFVPEANLLGSGAKVELRGVKKEGKREVAQLKVKALVLKMARTDALPGLDVTVKGELTWDLLEGRLVGASLEGPLKWEVGNEEGANVSAEGTLSWSFQAEVLERRAPQSDEARARGDPPPPGTQRLVCKKDPTHAYQLKDIRCCVMCGSELSADRVCKEHGWPLRHCAVDGSSLTPE